MAFTEENTSEDFPVHHYTNVKTLALILKHRKIRLSRLDKSNDPLESKASDIGNVGKFIYFSSWSKDSEESIPMWRMYCNPINYGIRISLPRFFYSIWHINHKEPVTFQQLTFKDFIRSEDKSILTIFPPGQEVKYKEKLDFHLIYQLKSNPLPIKMQYVDKEEFLPKHFYKMQEIPAHSGRSFVLNVIRQFGIKKHKRWEIENEYRYLVEMEPARLYPLAYIADEEKRKVYLDFIKRARNFKIRKRKLFDYETDGFYLHIHDSALEKMIILHKQFYHIH